jgi:biotin transport system ATP-binding protein
VIRVDAVDVVREDVPVLHGIDLRIEERRVAVIGANGSGKTTLARLLNGLVSPTAGRVTVDGHDTVRQARDVQRRVGFVFQDADHQLVYPTPLEDVALGLRARGRSRAEARREAAEALERLGLSAHAHQAVHTLSGGEKHLVALAAVLALRPEWIVLDEPTTSLDIVNRRRVVAALGELDQRLVIVSHDLELVASMERAILLSGGSVAADGAAGEVIEAYVREVGG